MLKIHGPKDPVATKFNLGSVPGTDWKSPYHKGEPYLLVTPTGVRRLPASPSVYRIGGGRGSGLLLVQQQFSKAIALVDALVSRVVDGDDTGRRPI